MSEKDPSFLGFGAFETTAFCTAILVAWYSLIPNPTGRQKASDRAEYQIYAGWRTALIAIICHVFLMIAVTVKQILSTQVERGAKIWLLLLMVAPWAPVAGKVRDTLTSGARVRRMMLGRLARNELLAILRDRFKFGQRSIALPSVIFHAGGILPRYPLETLLEHEELKDHKTALEEQAMSVAQLDDINSLKLGALWAMNQSSQPTSISRAHNLLWKFVSYIDIMARRWTKRTCEISIDVMPEVQSKVSRARYLDMIDFLQHGGTISDELAERGLKRFCEQCTLATRCAVEMFLESSERGHTDLRGGEWLKHVGIDWRGSFERVIDVMWEACFMDGNGLRMQGEDDDRSPSFNDRSKVTTTKVLALIFVLARSVVASDRDDKVYGKLCCIIEKGSFGKEWWIRYWNLFSEKMRAKNKNGEIIVDHSCRSVFKACARELADEDMEAIVAILLKHGVKRPLCGTERCFLNDAQLKPEFYEKKSEKEEALPAKKKVREENVLVMLDGGNTVQLNLDALDVKG